MPNEVPSSQSQNHDIPVNGGSTVPPEEENQDSHNDPRKYKLDDFSQQCINHGQQHINYFMVEVNEKIVEALTQLSIAVGAGSSSSGPVKEAIDKVAEANKKIAGEFPPGCGDPT